MADSAIKLNFCDRILPTETWNGFVQRLYEEYCIKELGEGAGSANKKANTVVWTDDYFSDFIKELTEQVIILGYDVSAPPIERLQTLLKKAEKGYVSKGDW